MLQEFPELKEELLLSKKDLFALSKDSAILPEKEKCFFHAIVVKLLYLSQRAHPDIITTISFLCTRVQSPTKEDMMKLEKLMGCLLRPKEKVLVLRPSQSFKVVVYIDASFATHNDGKSHSGIVIFVGGVAVFCALWKQKCVSKSLTEAELVTLSDNLGFVELFQEFITFVTNAKIEITLIFQDNTSIISMVTTGGGITRAKHMRTRMFLVLESIKDKRETIHYIHTSGMIANGLTKPIDGKDFDYYVNKVMECGKKSTGGRCTK